ncbi:ABC transporter permease [Nitratireductor pacificus]|uniref:Peptide ABC transporter permease n=1 Tax=Nitratireductor pacificus pht-3B TaxID=391937 RepID=K2ME64_9HYPH|nr:ABC transporter permease [Nitratireductor pacificus]EKF20471.1 peptide ABC transporter permease [Nitratireductor pacificus pht-3B]
MTSYIARRLLAAVPVLLLVSLLAFLLMQIVPGDPAHAMAGSDASVEEINELRRGLGLDRPWHLRLAEWYLALLQGDLGHSYTLRADVTDLIFERIPITLSIAIYSMLIAVPFSIVLGVLAARFRGSALDLGIMGAALLGVSVPNFWIGIMAILFFSVQLGWLPAGGYVPPSESVIGWLQSMTMPALVLGTMQMGLLTRITRSEMLEMMHKDFVRTARAKGASELRVMMAHALRNAIIPIVTVIGLLFGMIVTGAVVVEQVFSVPGLGRLIVQAILTRDYPLIQGTLLFVASAFVFVNLIVDLSYAFFDPRIRQN